MAIGGGAWRVGAGRHSRGGPVRPPCQEHNSVPSASLILHGGRPGHLGTYADAALG